MKGGDKKWFQGSFPERFRRRWFEPIGIEDWEKSENKRDAGCYQKGKNTIVRYLSYAKGCQAQKGNVHLYDINYITGRSFRNFCYYCKGQYNDHVKDGISKKIGEKKLLIEEIFNR